MKKQIIVLAKSVKCYPNYCIAGIDSETGGWIRPISSFDEIEGAIPQQHTIYTDGTELELLDVVEIDFIKHVPTKAQKENYTYNEDVKWKKVGKIEFEDVIKKYKFSSPKYIFGNSDKQLSDYELTGESLLLVKVKNPIFVVKNGYDGKRKFAFAFEYQGVEYEDINIGDKRLKDILFNDEVGAYYDPNWNEPYAVFSLTGQYSQTGKYYKMLAQLF